MRVRVFVFVSTVDGECNESYYPNGDYSLFFFNQKKPVYNDSRFINLNSIGLSNSRNECLKYAEQIASEGDLIILTDNDVKFDFGFDVFLRDCFKKHNVDVISFKVKNLLGHDFKSNYKKSKFTHNKFSLMRVSSVEYVIKFRKDLPRFDVLFGLGAEYPIGEENIFLTDLLKSGLELIYLPKYLCSHMDDVHSGTTFSVSKSRVRLMVFKRIYGIILGRFILLLFLFKNKDRLSDGFLNHVKVLF